ncbi:cytochrome P450 [Bimuria novae-zelandiae CBS 107.79]|uniref:Cytochrome P450 n=1 Tax=Bimuria novae-zelandiae CBS 107.79 TaxID=1447943 RepID=A0A6A5UVG2_9PLEO|nr:cytochrome P450 [Bimuria novae-zelandiae CBS 107.79]
MPTTHAALLVIHRIIYNVYFHPLSSFPGPFWVRATILWYIYHIYHADNHLAVQQLHLKYGPVVRVAPNEFLYLSPNIRKSIFGYKPNSPENIKDPAQSMKGYQGSGRDTILTAPCEEHGKMRRLLSHSFSDKALKEQEPVFAFYVDLVMEKLHDACVEPVDIFTTFDVIDHLVFAKPFDCLSSTKYHFWVSFFFETVRAITLMRSLNRERPLIIPTLMRLLPKDEQGILDPEELELNVPILIAAGSETTATLMSGATYFIGKDPRVYGKLVKEIRSAFKTKEEITISRVGELKYLSTVLDEALRLYPPTPTNRSRMLLPQGTTMEGQYIPDNALVGINFYAAFRSESKFHHGEEFVPERFLHNDHNDEFKHDRRDVLQPFYLALVEMRLIMARLLSEFDFEILPKSDRWIDQKSYVVWAKPLLMVRLRPVGKA